MHDWLAALPEDVPRVVVHYADGAPFRSMMDLDEDGRRAVLAQGRIRGAARFADPTYVASRRAVEDALLRQARAVGIAARRERPHYALLGRSARLDAAAAPGQRAWALRLEDLRDAPVSLTWGDSFCLDPAFRAARGPAHPASGRVHRLDALPEVLARWDGSTGRPGWQEIEVQLWFDPDEALVERIDLAG